MRHCSRLKSPHFTVARALVHSILAILGIQLALLLQACGGGGSSTPANAPAPPPVAVEPEPLRLTGRAADGYLGSAEVCLDISENGDCSDEEDSVRTFTGNDGEFILEALEEHFAQYPIVVRAVEGTTTDADLISDDNPTGIIPPDGGYTLKASPGLFDPLHPDAEVYVSPLTTLVENERSGLMEEEPVLSTAEALHQANQRLMEALNLFDDSPIDLNTDYIAHSAAEDGQIAALAHRVHATAQVTAGIIVRVERRVASALASDPNLDGALALRLALATTTEALDAITDQVADRIELLNEEIDSGQLQAEDYTTRLAEGIQEMISRNDPVETADALIDLVAVETAPSATTTAAEVLQSNDAVYAPNIVENYDYDVYEEVADVTFSAIVLDSVTNQVTLPRALLPSNSRYDLAVLSPDGWRRLEEEEEDTVTIPLNDDGSLGSPSLESPFAVDAQVESLDLEGLPIPSTLAAHSPPESDPWELPFNPPLWKRLLDDGSTFGPESTLYLAQGQVPTRVTLDGYDFVFLGLNFLEINTLAALNNSPGTLDEDDAVSIDEFSNLIHWQIGQRYLEDLEYGYRQLYVALQDGTAYIFEFSYEAFYLGAETVGTVITTAPASVQTLSGEDILVIPISDELSGYHLYPALSSAFSTSNAVAYSIFENEFRPVDARESMSFDIAIYNAAARDWILSAVNDDELLRHRDRARNEAVLDEASQIPFPTQQATLYLGHLPTTKDGTWDLWERHYSEASDQYVETGSGANVRIEVEGTDRYRADGTVRIDNVDRVRRIDLQTDEVDDESDLPITPDLFSVLYSYIVEESSNIFEVCVLNRYAVDRLGTGLLEAGECGEGSIHYLSLDLDLLTARMDELADPEREDKEPATHGHSTPSNSPPRHPAQGDPWLRQRPEGENKQRTRPTPEHSVPP